ncbi:MAG: peptidoglycan DD-metalloendopeptidase family protein [Chloroflexota bacterium]|nr:peptidoglycan DD-metalloendopeptidase family protein [Chloroflexota bacterium]
MSDNLVRLSILLISLIMFSGCSPAQSQPVQAPTAQITTRATNIVPAVTPSLAPPTPTAMPTRVPTGVSTPTSVATSTPRATAPMPTALPAAVAYSYPIGRPGRPLGDGFFIRHGFATENTWYNPGYWHTGEDWYAQAGDTAGARVYAIADGQVVYAGANYPGRVVIVRHADDLFSMYGHLDPNLSIRVDQQLARGDLIGTVLRRGDTTPNHLHFEIRTFLTATEVNGAAPRYPFSCGRNCPPGPGYWPLDASDVPSELGWGNPAHVLARRMAGSGGLGEVVVATKPISSSVTLWSAAPNDPARATLGELALQPGERYMLLDLYAGAEDTRETSARAYQLWYRIAVSDGRSGWVQAAVASNFETGSDGRPSSVSFNFFPAVDAAL